MVSLLEIVGNVLLFALVYCMSATVDVDLITKQFRQKTAILVGLSCQFFLLPILALLTVVALRLPASTGLPLLVVCSSPGGSYSNWYCSLFNAELSLSVCLTAISTAASIFVLPLNLLIYVNLAYERDVVDEVQWTSVVFSVVLVMTGIFGGLYSSYRSKSHDFNLLANQIGNFAGVSLVIFSTLIANAGSPETRIWNRTWDFYIGVSVPCLLGLLVSTGIAVAMKLKPTEVVTVSIECCYQNVGIATSMALSMFQGNALNHAMGVPFFYGICECLFVGVYCVIAWKKGWTKAPPDAPFWTVIMTSYEILEAENDDHDRETKDDIAEESGGPDSSSGYHEMSESAEAQVNTKGIAGEVL